MAKTLMKDLLSRTRFAKSLRVMRFGFIGGLATSIYLAASFSLEYLTNLSPVANNAIALTLSLLASYFGHKIFTYRAVGGDQRLAPLFLLNTAVIFIGAGVLQWAAVHLSGSTYASYVCVSLYYPVASFILHHFITFAETA